MKEGELLFVGFLLAGCFLDLLFDPDDGGSTVLRNAGELLATQHHMPEDNTLQSHRDESFKLKKSCKLHVQVPTTDSQ